MSGIAHPDPYTSQMYDHANLIILALAASAPAEPSGVTLKDTVRAVSQGKDGDKIGNALDGLKLLSRGRTIDYDGASGPCDFTDTGDITDCKFRYDEVKAKRLTLIRIS